MAVPWLVYAQQVASLPHVLCAGHPSNPTDVQKQGVPWGALRPRNLSQVHCVAVPLPAH